MALGLTPTGDLRWTAGRAQAVPGRLQRFQRAFRADWREALFALAATKTDTRELPVLGYWQRIAERHLTGLCHLLEGATPPTIETPTSDECAALVEAAPPLLLFRRPESTMISKELRLFPAAAAVAGQEARFCGSRVGRYAFGAQRYPQRHGGVLRQVAAEARTSALEGAARFLGCCGRVH